MELNHLFEKGNIDEYIKNLKYKLSDDEIKKIISIIFEKVKDLNPGNCLEISHESTNFYTAVSGKFGECYILCDDSFESLLAYNNATNKNIKLNVLNHSFSQKSLEKLKMNERFDLIISLLGLSYDNIFSLIKEIIGLLKVNAILAIIMPTYWFDRSNLNDTELKILNYSKKNDKKWIFTEELKPIIAESQSEILENIKLPFNIKFNRLEIAYLSSLNKLYDSILKNNIAHLEIADLPVDNLEIGISLMIIKKNKKTINKDNLFNV
jgi:hypothetical protein